CAKGAVTAAVHGLGLTPTMSIRNGVVSSSAGRMSSTGARRKGAKSFLLGLIPFIGEGRRGANFIKSIVPRYGMGNKQIHFCGEGKFHYQFVVIVVMSKPTGVMVVVG